MKILIVSQPKCGSTAIYYKLKKILGQQTRCYFEPSDLSQLSDETAALTDVLCKYLVQPWEGQFEPGLTNMITAFDRVIVLHRDPRDFMVSAYLYSFYDSLTAQRLPGMAQALGLLEAKERAPTSISFLDLVSRKNRLERGDHLYADGRSIPMATDQLGNPVDFSRHPLKRLNASAGAEMALDLEEDREQKGFLSYIGASCRTLMELKRHLTDGAVDAHWLAYDDLVSGRLECVERYLGLTLESPANVDQEHGRVVRTKRSGDWKNWMCRSDPAWLRDLSGEFLRTFGYPEDWELPEPAHLDPRFGSDYVYRLFEERNPFDLHFERETLTRLAAWLEAFPGESACLLPGLASAKALIEGPGLARIDALRVTTTGGETVNCLHYGQRYEVRYQVRLAQAADNVDCWMQVTNPSGYTVLNGSSFVAGSTLAQTGPGQTLDVAFAFECRLANSHYFLNAGVTSRDNGEVRVLHRQVAATAILVHRLQDFWLKPTIRTTADSS